MLDGIQIPTPEVAISWVKRNRPRTYAGHFRRLMYTGTQSVAAGAKTGMVQMPIGVNYIGVHIGATWRIRLNRPGKVLSGKRLSGKVIVRETSVTHAGLCQITLTILF